MKLKSIIYSAIVAVGFSAFYACSSDEEQFRPIDLTPEPPVTAPSTNPIEDNYFTIENGEFKNEAMPESTTEAELTGVHSNSQALKNGGNFVTISSPTEYDRFFVGIDGVDGYYEINASTVDNNEETTRATEIVEYFTYTIPVLYSVNLGNDFTLVIKGVTVEGYITKSYEAPITVVESLAGDLLINLVFDVEKDVDLHLIMPSGREIYFGNRGDYSPETNEQLFGLDHDSNPACNIDGLNNENISIPAEYVEKGTYKIRVNLWRNCDTSIPVNYSVQTRYKGNLLTNLLEGGTNPVRGYYKEDARSGDHTCVMEFYINEGIDINTGDSEGAEDNITEEQPSISRRRIPASPAAKAKLMMEEDF